MPLVFDGKYEVVEKLKEGGMGTVYKVRHLLLDEVRVVKTLKPQIEDDEQARRRFHHEAKLAATLHHPNLVTFHDFFETQDGAFGMAMEYVPGRNLAEVIRERGRLGVPEALDVALQTLDALAYLHSRGIVHRDISPENLMLVETGAGPLQVKLIDLGVAKESDAEGMTLSGIFVGKLKYCSPEQLGTLPRGERIDGRSDIYSLGCVAYQALTGQCPVEAESMQGYILGHARTPPRPFEETDPMGLVPAELREAVLKALA